MLERAEAQHLATEIFAEEARAIGLSTEQIAHRLGVHPSVIRRKLDPGERDALTLTDLVMAARSLPTLFAAVLRRLQSLAEQRARSGMSLLQHAARTSSECGDLARAVHEATLDGTVDDRELDRIDRELGELIAAAEEARRDVRASRGGR